MADKNKEKTEDRKKLTREEWKAKYGSDTQYYTHNLNKVDITTGKSVKSIIESVSKKYNLDPNFLASTLFTEGLDRYNVYVDKNNPSTREDYNSHPVSGMKHLGLDTLGNRKNELFKRGLIKKDEYEKDVIENVTKNEKDENVISGDFSSLEKGIQYAAAFLKMESDNIDQYAKKNNINMTPLQKVFFRSVAYNAGIGNAQKMLESYNDKGFLKDDTFIDKKPNEYWEAPYANAHKRTTAAIGLSENAGFSKGPEPEAYQKRVMNSRGEVAVVNSIDAKGLSPIEIKEQQARVKEEAISDVKANGLASTNAKEITASGITKAPELPQRRKEKTLLTYEPKKREIMPNTIPKAKKDEILKALKAGIAEIETGGHPNPYGATAGDKNKDGKPDSTAVGKYQFLQEWYSKKGAVKGVKEFADAYNGAFGQVNSMEDFKNNPELQDSYFEYYAENVLIPNAYEALKKNPKGLSLDQAAAMFHFQSPGNAKKVIQTGAEISETSTNTSTSKYLDTYNKGVIESGFSNVKIEDVARAKKAEGIELSPAEKIATKSAEERKADYIKRDKAIASIEDPKRQESLRNKLLQDVANNEDYDVWDDYIDEENEATQKDIEAKKEAAKKSQIAADVAAWKNREKTPKPSGKEVVTETTGVKNPNKPNKVELAKDIEEAEFTPRPTIDREYFKPQPKEVASSEEATTAEGDVTTTEGDTANTEASSKDKESLGLADQYAADSRREADRLNNSQNLDYDPKNIKREVPVQGLMGLALGITGLNEAKKVEIPKRDEKVSEAFNYMVGQLSKKAKDGLPPEVEAAMKNKLGEAYQGGFEQIRNMSGGNSAVILGNLGQLEVAKSKGLVDMQLADYEAKEQAFQQLLQAEKYISEFDARKDIANHAIDYGEARRKRDDAENLAAAGFQQLIGEIEYQRSNGPGSANDILRSATEQSIFGFDTKAKPGAPNSREAYLKKVANDKERAGLLLDYNEKIARLNPEQKKVFDQFAKENTNEKDIHGLVDFLSVTPEANTGNMDLNRITEATERGDMGLLFRPEQAKALQPITSTNPFNPSESGLLGNLPGITRPEDAPQKAPRREGIVSEINPNPIIPGIPEIPKMPELNEQLGLAYLK